MADNQSKPIIVYVRGGLVAGIANIPAGQIIEVHDYDTQDLARDCSDEELEKYGCQRDDDGDIYSRTDYEGTESGITR